MSKATLTRYNSFIPDVPGFYSCPSCYALVKSAPVTTPLKCGRCGLTAPILAGLIPIAIAANTTLSFEFRIKAVNPNGQSIWCAHCGSLSGCPLGAYNASCAVCGKPGIVSYRDVCNACLMRGKFVPATYVCSNPSVNHSAAHNQKLTVAGKCDSCHCNSSCKHI